MTSTSSLAGSSLASYPSSRPRSTGHQRLDHVFEGRLLCLDVVHVGEVGHPPPVGIVALEDLALDARDLGWWKTGCTFFTECKLNASTSSVFFTMPPCVSSLRPCPRRRSALRDPTDAVSPSGLAAAREGLEGRRHFGGAVVAVRSAPFDQAGVGASYSLRSPQTNGVVERFLLRPHQALDERTPPAAYVAVEHCD